MSAIISFSGSFHHILMDGWSSSLLIKDFFNFYGAVKSGAKVELGDGGGHIVITSAGCDSRTWETAEQFWRRSCKGFAEPTRLGIERKSIAARTGGRRSRTTSQSSTSDSRNQHRRVAKSRRVTQQVTLNTVVQGAWALLLSRYSGSEDVVFGATVSGRPASLAGVEEMVGLFINTLPVRVEVKSEEGVGGYLRRLQEQQVEVRQYEYSPLVEVQGWSEVGRGMRLFDTIHGL